MNLDKIIGKYVKIITKQDKIYSGFIIPSIDKNTVMIKLDNGYNIGFPKEYIKDVEILDKKIEVAEFPKLETIEYNPNLRDVSILVTGGTILSRIDYKTGGVHMYLKPEELLYNIPELQDFANIIEIVNPFSIASEDMTPKEWVKIAEQCYNMLERGVEGIIILHGTDTMHYTSSAISFMLQNLTKPICFTGAQRSGDRPSSDAFINLICATIYATSNIAEISIVMHESISDVSCLGIRGVRARKMHTSRRDAFKSINEKPLCRIFPNGKLEILNNNHKKYSKENNIILENKIEEKVALIKIYPGFSPEIIDYYIDTGYKGIIIEGTGFGHVAVQPLEKKYSLKDVISRAIEEDIFVGMTSQTIYGRTNPYVYSNGRILKNMGVVYLEDMLPEVAYTKLMWVLGKTQNIEEVKTLMLTNFCNEFTNRSLYINI